MKITDTYIYFWSGIYSNWEPCQFIDPITEIKFYNTEQAFMWYKAEKFNDIEIQKLIEITKDPRKVKDLGRQIKNYNDSIWTQFKYQTMVYVNKLKFSQNENLKLELKNTGNKILVEASPLDFIWGVGLSENDPLILDELNWKGTNLLGKSLMEVRSNL